MGRVHPQKGMRSLVGRAGPAVCEVGSRDGTAALRQLRVYLFSILGCQLAEG